MKLCVVIPALNEEGAIQSIIERTLEAREHIYSTSPVTDVEIVVVSDGSTDRTVEIASQYSDRIRLIVFPKNRGYGAAIKTGWEDSNAELLAFLDADGTCDPKFFAPLATKLSADNADVILGCRLNRGSEMPAIRRVGNTIFALLLSAFSSARVRDTASGMRVIRRSAIDKLYPLPDGLHFTPAMSAKAMLLPSIRIEEIDMPYRERVGESKLRVVKDGLRFLRVILEAAFLYRPSRPLGILSLFFFLAATVLMIPPVLHYASYRSLEEWMIYRFLTAQLLGIAGTAMLCASYLSSRMTEVALSGEIGKESRSLTVWFFRSAWFWTANAAMSILALVLVGASVIQRLTTGATTEHWSRYVAAVFFLSVVALLLVTRTLDIPFWLVQERLRYWQEKKDKAVA